VGPILTDPESTRGGGEVTDLRAAVAERLGDEVRRVGESVELNKCDDR